MVDALSVVGSQESHGNVTPIVSKQIHEWAYLPPSINKKVHQSACSPIKLSPSSRGSTCSTQITLDMSVSSSESSKSSTSTQLRDNRSVISTASDSTEIRKRLRERERRLSELITHSSHRLRTLSSHSLIYPSNRNLKNSKEESELCGKISWSDSSSSTINQSALKEIDVNGTTPDSKCGETDVGNQNESEKLLALKIQCALLEARLKRSLEDCKLQQVKAKSMENELCSKTSEIDRLKDETMTQSQQILELKLELAKAKDKAEVFNSLMGDVSPSLAIRDSSAKRRSRRSSIGKKLSKLFKLFCQSSSESAAYLEQHLDLCLNQIEKLEIENEMKDRKIASLKTQFYQCCQTIILSRHILHKYKQRSALEKEKQSWNDALNENNVIISLKQMELKGKSTWIENSDDSSDEVSVSELLTDLQRRLDKTRADLDDDSLVSAEEDSDIDSDIDTAECSCEELGALAFYAEETLKSKAENNDSTFFEGTKKRVSHCDLPRERLCL